MPPPQWTGPKPLGRQECPREDCDWTWLPQSLTFSPTSTRTEVDLLIADYNDRVQQAALTHSQTHHPDYQVWVEAMRDELMHLWTDLEDAIRWSRQHTNLRDRIEALTAVVGPCSWHDVPVSLMESGLYQRIHYELGYDVHPDMDRVAEVSAKIYRPLPMIRGAWVSLGSVPDDEPTGPPTTTAVTWDTTEVRTWWQLSFADEKGFLGGFVTEAPDFTTAYFRSIVLGVNPGGEVQGLGYRATSVAPGYVDRLLSKQEVLDMPQPEAVEILEAP